MATDPSQPSSSTYRYDAIIVGAGIAGPALAYALSTLRKPPARTLRIGLMDRSFAEPNRIVGELLQPGGMRALRELGMDSCVNDIDAIKVHGYAVLYQGSTVHIPYPNDEEGRSFHHGRFVMNLREKARDGSGVELIEATVSDLLESTDGRVTGVRATRKNADGSSGSSPEDFHADIVFVADGWSSKFRSKVMGDALRESKLKSHFVGFVLEDIKLPIPEHGTVALVPGTGPVLLYQIGTSETRMLVDVQGGLPKDMPAYMKSNIMPHLPENIHSSILNCMAKERPKSMPNSFLPASLQGSTHHKPGAVLIGDSWNMRHPLTGGGMTVAFSDIVILRRLLEPLFSAPNDDPSAPPNPVERPFEDWAKIVPILSDWHWQRKGLSSTVNILSVALYDLFGAEDENLFALREGCFKYFERGGECINGPVSLLSGLAPRPMLLAYHFFSVAFYSIYVLFTHPRPRPRDEVDELLDEVTAAKGSDKLVMVRPSVLDYPFLMWKSILCIYTACFVFLPLVWSEVRWW